MWRPRDSDFRDERQSRVYPRLAGCEDTENEELRKCSETKLVIPDLALLSDDEFQQRITNMRNDHQLTLELCDKLGIYEKEEIISAKASLPVAVVDDEYTLSTEAYTDKSPVRSPDFVHKKFKATRPPADINRAKSADVLSNRKQLKKDVEVEGLDGEEKDIAEYKLRKYLEGLDYAKEVYSRDLTDKNGVPKHRCNEIIEMMMENNKNLSKVKTNEWKHRVTIPKPFQMTVREMSKGSGKTKAQASWEREKERRDKKEMQECQKIFKASPLPADIYIPLYDELIGQKAQQRHRNHMSRREFLLSHQNPFSFIEREKRKQLEVREKFKTLEDSDKRGSEANFVAKPFPKKMFDNSVYEKMRDEEEMRLLRMDLRAAEMLRSSSLPKNMTKKRKNHKCALSALTESNCIRSDNEAVESSDGDTDSLERTGGKEKERRKSQSRWPSTHLAASPLSRSLTDFIDSSATTTLPFRGRGRRVSSSGRNDYGTTRVASSLSTEEPYYFSSDDEDFTRSKDGVSDNFYNDHDHCLLSDHYNQSYDCRPDQLHYGIA